MLPRWAPEKGRQRSPSGMSHPTAGSGLACAGVDGDDAVQPEAAPLVPVGRQCRQQPVHHRRRRCRPRRVRVVVVQDPARPRPVGIAAAAGERRGQGGEERRGRRRPSGARGRPRAGAGAAGEGVGGGEFLKSGEPRRAVREARHGRPEHGRLAGRERHHPLQGPRQVRDPDQPQVVRRRRLLAAVAVVDGDLAFAGAPPRPRHRARTAETGGAAGSAWPEVLLAALPPPPGLSAGAPGCPATRTGFAKP